LVKFFDYSKKMKHILCVDLTDDLISEMYLKTYKINS
jgi:hypothetical protein